MNAVTNSYWQKQPGLIWSNPAADDSAHIRAALTKPRFSQLLAIATEFGVERLRVEWNELRSEDVMEIKRARAAVDRILANIEKGFALAATRH